MKIMIFSSDAQSLVDFRGDLMKEMILRKHQVIAVAPPDPEYEEQIKSLGVKFIGLQFNRVSTNPLHDINYLIKLRKTIYMEQADLVFSYFIKPVIFASIAAKSCKIKKIYSMLPGLGYAFNKETLKEKIINLIVSVLFKVSLSCCNKVILQNLDDLKQLVDSNVLKEGKCYRVNGSGVNMKRFAVEPMPDKPVFLMVSRIIKDKGIYDYIESARKVKIKYPEACFYLLGPFDSNPKTMKQEELTKMISDGCVEYLGMTKDVRPYIALSSVFVLPSYYSEGVPRSILEAMAMGRAIITTDSIGCKDTVINGENGFLVQIKNPDELSDKMIWMIEHIDDVNKMGKKSLEICKEKFDVQKVNEIVLNIMEV